MPTMKIILEELKKTTSHPTADEVIYVLSGEAKYGDYEYVYTWPGTLSLKPLAPA